MYVVMETSHYERHVWSRLQRLLYEYCSHTRLHVSLQDHAFLTELDTERIDPRIGFDWTGLRCIVFMYWVKFCEELHGLDWIGLYRMTASCYNVLFRAQTMHKPT